MTTKIASLSQQLTSEAKIIEKISMVLRMHVAWFLKGAWCLSRTLNVPDMKGQKINSKKPSNVNVQRNQLQSQIDGLASNDAAEGERLEQKIAATQASVSELRHAFRAAADRNPIYRIGTYFYGVDVLEPEQLARVRLIFATFSDRGRICRKCCCPSLLCTQSHSRGAHPIWNNDR